MATAVTLQRQIDILQNRLDNGNLSSGASNSTQLAINRLQAQLNALGSAASHPTATPAPPPTDPNSFATSALAWTSTIGMSAMEYASWHAQIVAALQAGILDPGGQYATQTGKCQGATVPPSNSLALAAQSLGLAGAAAGVATTIAGIAASAAPIIGAAVAGGTLLIQLFSKLFGPATSALEGKYLCPLVASANQVLVQIMAELQAGQINAATAGQAVTSLAASFDAQIRIPEPLGGQTNALIYYNTPNDSQFMDSALGAMRDYNIAVRYPQLAQQGGAKIAAVAAAQQAQLNAQIQADVQAAVAAQAQTQVPKPVTVQQQPPAVILQPQFTSISTQLLIGIAAAIAATVLMAFVL